MCEEVAGFKNFKLREFNETMVHVNRRTCMIQIDGIEEACIIPFTDMMNHMIPGKHTV